MAPAAPSATLTVGAGAALEEVTCGATDGALVAGEMVFLVVSTSVLSGAAVGAGLAGEAVVDSGARVDGASVDSGLTGASVDSGLTGASDSGAEDWETGASVEVGIGQKVV